MRTFQQLMYQRKEEIKERVLAGEKFADIGKDFDCAAGSVHYFYKRHCCGDSPGESRYCITEQNKDKIIKLFEENNSCSKIAQIVDIDHTSICKSLKKWGYDPSIRLCRDPNNLLKDKTNQVLELYDSGLRCSQIARKLGHAKSCVKDILIANNREVSRYYYTVDEQYFSNIDTSEKAYVLGWFYSDGNVCSNKHTFSISLQARDKYILEWIQIKQLKYTGPLYYIPENKKENRQAKWTLAITRPFMAQDLIKFGCVPRKTWELRFPSIDLFDKSLFSHMIRGYFDGNGCATKKSISIVGNYWFIYALADWLKQVCGADYTNIYHRFDKFIPDVDNYIVYYGRQEEIKKVAHYLYDNAPFFLVRKYDKIKHLLEV